MVGGTQTVLINGGAITRRHSFDGQTTGVFIRTNVPPNNKSRKPVVNMAIYETSSSSHISRVYQIVIYSEAGWRRTGGGLGSDRNNWFV